MSSITKLVLRRPVTTILAVLCLIFFGFMSILNSKLELMPDMNLPLILITTSYPGASPTEADRGEGRRSFRCQEIYLDLLGKFLHGYRPL